MGTSPKKEEIKELLDELVDSFNRPEFIICDPISIPHRFSRKEDIEIAGFLTATIAWGNRVMILRNASAMMAMMDNSPYDFVMNHNESDLAGIKKVIHRTFNSTDFIYFIQALGNVYKKYKGIEAIFTRYQSKDSLQPAIHSFKEIFFELPHEIRTTKHISDPVKGSAAKRINMFLRWMVRNDERGVDFGLWNDISPSRLSCPLDVHSGRIARSLGILSRKQSDAKAVVELDSVIRSFDPLDPVKYDFALFGLGVTGKC
jgi:uncharacterized protein (TIGR02757 family)